MDFEDFAMERLPMSDDVKDVQELAHLVQEYIRTRFVAAEDDFQEIARMGLLVPETIVLLFEIAVIKELGRLHDETDGNIEQAIELARSKARE